MREVFWKYTNIRVNESISDFKIHTGDLDKWNILYTQHFVLKHET